MASDPSTLRQGEYATRGDYHRVLDPTWAYYPTYLAKLKLVRAYLDDLPDGTTVLDAGCGEGVLVEEYAARLAIEGVDHAYRSSRVTAGSLTQLPYPEGRFARVLCLDVLEHLGYADQRQALAELHRVLQPNGELLLSVPNLAHLQSRVRFLLAGELIRTADPRKHPGDRPIAEYLRLVAAAGFRVTRRKGVFPTLPLITHLIRRQPRALRFLHDGLTRALPIPGWCFLNLLWLRKA